MENNFTTEPLILSQSHTDTTWEYVCRVPQNLLFTRGHFDEFPLVPGVCQLKWIIDFIARQQGQDVVVHRLEKTKFHNFLFPEQQFVIQITRREDHYSYLLSDGEIKFASGKIFFK